MPLSPHHLHRSVDPRLQTARIFILGAGGLGAPLAWFLARAGIGHLVIADSDRVERSNLPRQILHVTARVGAPKAESARLTLQRIHPATRVTPIPARITATNILQAVAGCDLAVDGSDNYSARHRLNRACLNCRIPLVSGAVSGFEGQVATFHHGVDPEAPCYHCLYPETNANDTSETDPTTCATAGVLGPVAGVIAALLAAEVVKTVLNRPAPHDTGSLRLINLRNSLDLRIAIPKDPACPVCARPPILPNPPT
ncbi:MAG: HesA/MoeB/ThiF family protein [Magnetococcales bacterium]|nr:HesA/MoeB/ThiF family protein [Magnetococcales bacterium]